MAQTRPTGPNIAPDNDLYTVLLIVAATCLLIGTVFVSVQTVRLFDSIQPPGGG